MKSLWGGIVVLLALLVPAAPVEGACTITTTAVSFGVYDPFGLGPNDSTGRVTYRCGRRDRNITIMLATGASGTFNPRTMFVGVEGLTYNLYRNAARSRIWGDGSGGTRFYRRRNPPNNRNVVLTVYARIPANQDVSAGTYTDSVPVVINF